MKRTLLAAVAALAVTVPAGGAIAQDTSATVTADAAGTTVALTADQQAAYDGWAADRRGTYDAWPHTYRTYYWTLTPEQQAGWWALTEEQRARVYAMPPEQRTAAWASIAAQMSAAAPVATTSADASMTTTASTGNMQFVRREVTQPVAASADATALASGDLPVCKPNQQDGCINGWEKNRKGNKPLSYWPGKPASEIPGKKPDPQ